MSSGVGGPIDGASGFADLIDRLPTVGLDEVNREAELQTRTDRKYIVSAAQLDDLVGEFGPGCSVLQLDDRRRFSYSTTYHDTPDRRLHRDTAHRRPTRFKVRVREYVDSGLAMLEVKAKNARGRTVKHRVDATEFDRGDWSPHDRLTEEMRTHVDAVLGIDLAERLEPALRVDFHRTTLLTASGDARCTIDIGLRAEDQAGAAVDPAVVVIETKSARRASAIDRLLWARGVRPTRFSKYCTSMAALDASLPANHWHRQLRTHFPPRRQPTEHHRVPGTG